MKKKFLLVSTLICMPVFFGCLEETSQVSEPEPEQEQEPFYCVTEPLQDLSGLKVICGGDSVGIVQNGKDGKDGLDGIDGKDGEKGEKGDKGNDGKDGVNGKDGVDGKDGKDGTSCYIAENAKIDGFDIYCGDEKVGELHNGKDGADGKDGANGKDGVNGKDGTNGKDGKDGASCTVKVNAENNGYDIYCGGEKAGELHNGKDGANGKDGTNGKDGANGKDGNDGKDGKDGASCTVKQNNGINGFDIFCGNEKVGELHNGADGKDGANGKDGTNGKDGNDGKDGKDGASCYTVENTEGNGYDVYCGDEKVGTLRNGANGKDGTNGEKGADGKDGKDGVSCYVAENLEINGFDVYCGNVKVGELKNGANGKDGIDGKDGKDGTSCSVVKNDKINGYEVYCGNEKIGELYNGKDGKDGADGKDGTDGKDGNNGIDGKDGTSCRVEANDDINGYDVYCGKEKVGEIRNGEKGADGKDGKDGTDGKDGNDGKDGTSCRVEANDDINGFDVYCGEFKVGELRNGENGKDGKDGADGKDGNDGKDGTSCRVEENLTNNGYDIFCGSIKVGELKNGENGKDGADGKDGTDGKDGKDGKDGQDGKDGEDGKDGIQLLSAECRALRSTTDQFSSIYDVFGCLRPTEKATFILRHAARPSDKYGPNDPLNETGMQQCATVGNRLKEMNLDDFSYMHTYYYRAKQSAWIIGNNKGQYMGDSSTWFGETDNSFQTTNNDLLEKVYVKNEGKRSSCKSGWGGFAKAAYREYDNDNQRNNCEAAFYNIDSIVDVVVQRHFTYDKMKPGVTLAISHDQFLAPFVISISKRKIHGDNGRDLRYHKYSNDQHWINYLSGVAIITDPDDNIRIIPVTALDKGFLQ